MISVCQRHPCGETFFRLVEPLNVDIPLLLFRITELTQVQRAFRQPCAVHQIVFHLKGRRPGFIPRSVLVGGIQNCSIGIETDIIGSAFPRRRDSYFHGVVTPHIGVMPGLYRFEEAALIAGGIKHERMDAE